MNRTNYSRHRLDTQPEPKKKKRALGIVLKALSFVFILIGVILLDVVIICAMIFDCPKQKTTVATSEGVKTVSLPARPTAACKYMTTSFLESGQMKFIPKLFLNKEQIQDIVDSNKLDTFDEEIDTGIININTNNDDIPDVVDDKHTPKYTQDGIEVYEIPGRTYTANLIKIKDPSRVSVATIYNNGWRDQGVTLDVLVNNAGAIAGINGGIYNSYNNSGGKPFGVCVSNGEIQENNPSGDRGYVLIGMTEDNILDIFSIEGMTPAQMTQVIKEKKIRDAVTFQEESSDSNNHFVQLVINGKPRGMNGAGSGLNPRTAIGQCSDGSILFLVTDGRGKSGHLGASASDLIDIMLDFGAVNAANLDGGSSSCMYYDGNWLMTSVTFYYTNSSWKLPFAFVAK